MSVTAFFGHQAESFSHAFLRFGFVRRRQLLASACEETTQSAQSDAGGEGLALRRHPRGVVEEGRDHHCGVRISEDIRGELDEMLVHCGCG